MFDYLYIFILIKTNKITLIFMVNEPGVEIKPLSLFIFMVSIHFLAVVRFFYK